MHNKEKGFSLLECVAALVLFCLLLQGLLNFFSTIYVNYKQFEKRTYLMDNARAVNEFISEKIRKSDSIRVEIKDASGDKSYFWPIAVVNDNYLDENQDGHIRDTVGETHLPDGFLCALTLVNTGTGEKTGIIMTELTGTTDPNKGKYKLEYVTYASLTSNVVTSNILISDMIENIKVKREKDSDLVEFKCSINKLGETLSRLKMEECFTESLLYKQQYGYLGP